jgi:hypothetical protein
LRVIHKNAEEAFRKKLDAKMNERIRLRQVEAQKLFKRCQNVTTDLNLQHNIDTQKKQHKYVVIARTHSACRFENAASLIFTESEPFETTIVGGRSRMSWRDRHNERLGKSLKTLHVEKVTEQKVRQRIVTKPQSIIEKAKGSSRPVDDSQFDLSMVEDLD